MAHQAQTIPYVSVRDAWKFPFLDAPEDASEDSLAPHLAGDDFVHGTPLDGMGSNGSEPRTTVMLHNLPCRYTPDDVATFLDESGLKDMYDFVDLPCAQCQPGKKPRSNFGYGFVNFIRQEFYEECFAKIDGRPFQRGGAKVCRVVQAQVQGYAHCHKHFTRKRAKHQSVLYRL